MSRHGQVEADQRSADEAAACLAFWQRFVDHELPTLPGVDPSEPDKRRPVPAEPDDDLTVPEVLAIWRRRGVSPPVGVHSPSHGVDFGEDPAYSEPTDLYEVGRNNWELRYAERGTPAVIARYSREGDACASILGWQNPAGYAPATEAKLDSSHEATSYRRLLHCWRRHPWQHRPGDRGELAVLLRDNGFPRDSYHLSGGRAVDALTIEERLDHWRVYQVRKGKRVDQTMHTTEADACAEHWRRAVDEVIPSLPH